MKAALQISLLFLLVVQCVSWSMPPSDPIPDPKSTLPRRQALLWISGGLVSTAQPANAFENKISNKYDDRPKRRGPQPKDLGVAIRQSLDQEEYVGLKGCGPAPNCFSSTIPDDPDHSVPAFIWPKDKDQEAAFLQLEQVLKKYTPGQNGVDGGGFEIRTVDAKKGYIYVQYEALKNGYIDDVEFAVIPGTPERSVQVRSSSRIGYLDFGVNGKRLNFIANALRAEGWEAEGVDYKTHPLYTEENRL
ncbi:hypothetical protein FisN_UnNu050 [Fistulifera solaris]|jgi:uncharacterized protein (DUF1499 family)|uniref:Uncharacterized protein n=1 Tax=Fistulifera solaris TaxID=1519565 RepID=A0A1Z5JLR5_FISSO|nr:hypothetical protein FisN_UnNu050 [Fistulifera solaris]|eukprot:GAX14919.1 hypothetical protein FisN_UnNu050 [Fistulifera solaris]